MSCWPISSWSAPSLSWGAYLTLEQAADPPPWRHCRSWRAHSSWVSCSRCRSPWSPCRAGCRCSARLRPGAWISLAILALLITPLNLALQNLSLRRLDASQVATFSNVAPVLTVVWGVWFFHESLASGADRRGPPDPRAASSGPAGRHRAQRWSGPPLDCADPRRSVGLRYRSAIPLRLRETPAVSRGFRITRP